MSNEQLLAAISFTVVLAVVFIGTPLLPDFFQSLKRK